MFSGEGLANRQGTPQRHLNASQVQLPGHHQTIATVVARPDQDHNAIRSRSRRSSSQAAIASPTFSIKAATGIPLSNSLCSEARMDAASTSR
jgi:hypothetical protein